jgi:rhamnosyltransferase
MPRQVGEPAVSIALVTRNGIATLPEVLDAIDAQEVPFPFEIVAIDSGSTDGTRELLEGRVDTLVTIDPAAFNHGATRNLAIEHARAALVVLLVQDATPANRQWLRALTNPFATDPGIAGVFCRQVPRDTASGLTRQYLERWFASGEQPRRVAFSTPAALAALSPLEQLDRCTFDNVCSCLRTSVWQAYPFAATSIAEDLEWAQTVLRAGHAVAYVPDAVVVHSHERSARYEFALTYVLHRRLFELFGVRTIPTLPALAIAVGSTARAHLRARRTGAGATGPGSMWRSLALALAWPSGQYFGALSAVKRWAPLRFRGV